MGKSKSKDHREMKRSHKKSKSKYHKSEKLSSHRKKRSWRSSSSSPESSVCKRKYAETTAKSFKVKESSCNSLEIRRSQIDISSSSDGKRDRQICGETMAKHDKGTSKDSSAASKNFASHARDVTNNSAFLKSSFQVLRTHSRVDQSENEKIEVNWKDHVWELNKLFFSDRDIIKKGSEEYNDFWKFLQKYEMVNKKCKENDFSSSTTSVEVPSKKFCKRYCINFALEEKSISELEDRLPPYDCDDERSKARLTKSSLEEFKLILLLFLDFLQKQRFKKLKTIRKTQNNLPIAEYKSKIIDTIEANSVVIIAGDTGCGKSTQIPQYLLSSGYSNIACTQPRRIACIALSKRVAYETLNEYGTGVGFQIRFEKTRTENTKLTFVTEGLLLRQISVDPFISQYSAIILDEIHERHLQTDFLLGVVKCLVIQRPDIKIILMSATINIDLFSNYFMGKAPVIQIPGRLYPIELKYFPISTIERRDTKYSKLDPSPYVRILQLIDNNYPSDERGDVLIFMSGVKEIATVIDAAKEYAAQSGKWVVLPLHSTLSIAEQEKVFDLPPEGVRKCIVSTNIAETSVTIDGIRFVVDSGKVKEMNFDSIHKMRRLKEFWVSQASAEQRKGRAGRTGPGVCYRLYSEEDYTSFSSYTTPEIQRVPLDSLVLQMITMGLPSIDLFPFIEPPTQESLETALSSLKSHSALTSSGELTSIGKLLAQLPLDISLGKMLIMGSIFNMLGPVLSLASAMSVQSPFTKRAYQDPDCFNLNKEFHSNHGDPFLLLNVYKEWLEVKTSHREQQSRNWCRKRGLEEQRFFEMTKLRDQFCRMMEESGLMLSLSETTESESPLTSSERAQKYGQLAQLRYMKRNLHRQGPRKARVLKLNTEDDIGGDDIDNSHDNVEENIKDIDFRIKFDHSKLRKVIYESEISSFKQAVLLKVILASSLYPNFSIPDEHNTFKGGSDQFFHSPTKPFVIPHPNSTFAVEPEILDISQSDATSAVIGSTERHPVSSKQQLLCYSSILETEKAYLINSFRCSTAQTLLLVSRNIDSNADCSTLVFDQFVEIRFLDRIAALNLISLAFSLRSKMKTLLEMRLEFTKPSIVDEIGARQKASLIERELRFGLISFYQTEPFCSVRRLLKADVKVLYKGPGLEDVVLSSNPFSEDINEPCLQNITKGGFDLSDFFTYNSLLDLYCDITPITPIDFTCTHCELSESMAVLEVLHHMNDCQQSPTHRIKKKSVDNAGSSSQIDIEAGSSSTWKKDFINVEHVDNEQSTSKKRIVQHYCEICHRTLSLTVREIFLHKKEHLPSASH